VHREEHGHDQHAEIGVNNNQALRVDDGGPRTKGEDSECRHIGEGGPFDVPSEETVMTVKKARH
jgi:hypothetical protein